MLSSAARATSTRGIVSRSRSFASVVDVAGLKVATVDNGQPTSSVTFLMKAGSRYENKPGIAHVLKNFGFKNTVERSALRTVRESELYGGVLSSSLTREHLAYTADFLRGDEAYFVDVLASVLTATRFTRYELEESVLPNVNAESTNARADPVTYALELAHALAFRSGLGESLFAEPNAHITVGDVQSYAGSAFGKGNVAVLGTGISQDTLARLVQKHLAPAPEAQTPTSATTTYHGGETRVPFSEHHGRHNTVFIGFGVPGQSSAELAVLATHLSPASSVKWSSGTSPLSTTLPAGTSVQAVLLPYSDATLFGLLVHGKTPEGVAEAGKAAVKAFKAAGSSNGIKAEDLKKAVAKAKFVAANATEDRQGLVSAFASMLLAGSHLSLESMFASLDGVNISTFTKAARNLLETKPTFVAVGDTNKLPYLDELGL
ncbi:Metalloenzyme, LuxS/M16 peptidase-like protein [Gautieria morchelliformis]|nr:Metalloenzyme, LuxS/M16 peptidase-like protein [Gautieria morchelliformis]